MKSWLKFLARRILYQPRGMTIGKTSVIRRPRWILNPERIKIGEHSRILRHARLEAFDYYSGQKLDGHIVIGDDVYIGCYCMICAMDEVRIEDGCVISDRVYIADNAHGLDPNGLPIMKQPLSSKGPVIIGRRTFIGVGASILPGVTLGENCIVGTLSVVTKSFPAYSMIAGNPAKLIKRYDHGSLQWISCNQLT